MITVVTIFIFSLTTFYVRMSKINNIKENWQAHLFPPKFNFNFFIIALQTTCCFSLLTSKLLLCLLISPTLIDKMAYYLKRHCLHSDFDFILCSSSPDFSLFITACDSSSVTSCFHFLSVQKIFIHTNIHAQSCLIYPLKKGYLFFSWTHTGHNDTLLYAENILAMTIIVVKS